MPLWTDDDPDFTPAAQRKGFPTDSRPDRTITPDVEARWRAEAHKRRKQRPANAVEPAALRAANTLLTDL